MKVLKIVTRESGLALWQANFVKDNLQALYPDLEISLIGVTTEGDKILDVPLTKIGGKGLFVKALEEKLLNHEADIAVHSLKDMPAELPEGLLIGAILEREDPTDAFVSNKFSNIEALPSNAIVGTSSLRRQSQLSAIRSDLSPQTLRGNVNTRLQKLDNHEFDGILLASAGLKRLGLADRITEILPPQKMLSAVGQGALGIECRNEEAIRHLIMPLHHARTAQCVLAERNMNAMLGGSCQSPVAGLAIINNDGMLKLEGMVATPDGKTILRAWAVGNPEAMHLVGKQVAEKLLEQGADRIIAACKI